MTSTDIDAETPPWRPMGFSALTPFIVVADAERALDFYQSVFGARLVSKITGPEGPLGRPLVMQADLDFGAGRLQLADPNPAFGMEAVQGGGPIRTSIALYVPDVDAVLALGESHGGTIAEPAAQFSSGDRYGVLIDPLGVRWPVLTRTEALTDEESTRRVQAWADSLAGE